MTGEADHRFELQPGDFDPAAMAGRAPALLVTDGLVLRDMGVGGRDATDLLGPRDVIPVGGEPDAFLRPDVRWAALTPTAVVVLDEAVVGRVLSASTLVRLMTEQCQRMAVHRAVNQLPRVEDRVLGVLWLLAGRWGSVAPDGVVVDLSLTHAVLGRLTGARRPTVSIALKGLAADGIVTRRPGGALVLEPGSERALNEMAPMTTAA